MRSSSGLARRWVTRSAIYERSEEFALEASVAVAEPLERIAAC